jgi:uncharacterized protein YegJ (DUF2314 family)
MSRNLAAVVVLAALATSALLVMPGRAGAQTLLEKVERDKTIAVPSDDPDMAAAMRKARATLPEFLALARSPRATMSKFAVKVAVRDKGAVEYFWISPFVQRDARFSGEINNSPETVKNVKLGDTITFAEAEIVDWLYLEGTQMKGNYTACVLFKQAPREEAEAAIKRYGMSCDL